MKENLWSQGVVANWRPHLDFFDRKLKIVRYLEKDGLVRGFRVEENEIGVLLDAEQHELVVGPRGMRLIVQSPRVNYESINAAALVALQVLDPPAFTSLSGSTNLVAEMKMSYEDARRTSASALFGPWSNEIGITDHATLIDGISSNGKATFQCEFGVVARDEVPRRLSRRAGRLANEPGRAGPPEGYWNSYDIPETALFVGTTWAAREISEGATLFATLTEFWGEIRGQAEAFLTLIMSAVASENERRDAV